MKHTAAVNSRRFTACGLEEAGLAETWNEVTCPICLRQYRGVMRRRRPDPQTLRGVTTVYVVVTGGFEEKWIEGIYPHRDWAERRKARVEMKRDAASARRFKDGIEYFDLGRWTKIEEWPLRGGC